MEGNCIFIFYVVFIFFFGYFCKDIVFIWVILIYVVVFIGVWWILFGINGNYLLKKKKKFIN